MKKYIVQARKIEYSYVDITVYADNKSDAEDIAYDQADNNYDLEWDNTELEDLTIIEVKLDRELTEADEVYYWYSATDCDGMHVEHAVKYPCQLEADKAIEAEAYNAEGAFNFNPLSKDEYNEAKGESIRHDRAAEAMGY